MVGRGFGIVGRVSKSLDPNDGSSMSKLGIPGSQKWTFPKAEESRIKDSMPPITHCRIHERDEGPGPWVGRG